MTIRLDIVDLRCAQKVVDRHHIMRKWDAVGVSESILLNLKFQGIKVIRLIVVGVPTKVYYASVDQYLTSSKVHEFFKGDKQLFVSLCDMLQQDYTVQTNLTRVVERG